MRTCIFLLFCFFSSTVFSQYRTISGTLTDENGEPLIGVNIIEKGTSNGVVSNYDGYYSISVPVGSTLVYSYIGFETREVVVGFGNVNKESSSGAKFFPVELLEDSVKSSKGIGTFDANSSYYKVDKLQSINNIKRIRQGKKKFVLKYYENPFVEKGAGLQFSTSLGSTVVDKYPEFQDQYAQGRPVNGDVAWRGPSENEVFSWGPKLINLEYDGSDYIFDSKGSMVPFGTGNGNVANAYENDLFRIAYSSKYNLLFTHSLSRKGHIIIGATHELSQDIIPCSGKKNSTFSVDIEDVSLGESSLLTYRSFYNQASGTLLAHGSNIARIIGEGYSTPVTFDNTNGMVKESAILNRGSYLLQDGSNRSFSPDYANNPFQLISGSPDRDGIQHYFSGIEYNFEKSFDVINKLELKTAASYDNQILTSDFGFLTGTIGFIDGKLSSRLRAKEQFDYDVASTYKVHHKYRPFFDLYLDFDYHLTYTSDFLEKTTGTGFVPGSDISMENAAITVLKILDPHRIMHEIQYGTRIEFDHHIMFDIRNRSYFSNTADLNAYTNFFPHLEAGAALNIYQVEFHPRISYSRTIQESSLIYSDWAYQSLDLASGEYRLLFEEDELEAIGLIPEIGSVFQIGMNTRLFYYLNFKLDYTFEAIDNYIVPVLWEDQYRLMNAARITNRSFRTSFDIDHRIGGYDIDWHLGIRWSVNNTKVEDIYLNREVLPLAGFENAATVLIEGQEIGVIFGRAYRRNSNGDIIIGPDGFPEVSGERKILGNPNPDWILGMDPSFKWKNIKLEAQFEIHYGGEIWNGTSAYLDYLGRSKKTADQREIRDYIFEGVDAANLTNSIPVDFFDPEQDVSQNRWTRYGPEGIAEEYIEDATNFRIRNLIISRTLTEIKGNKFKEISISFLFSNLYLYNAYSGVNPEGTLFGYSQAKGLDLFNSPSTKSVAIKISCKL